MSRKTAKSVESKYKYKLYFYVVGFDEPLKMMFDKPKINFLANVMEEGAFILVDEFATQLINLKHVYHIVQTTVAIDE